MSPLTVHVVIPARNEQQLIHQAVTAALRACATAAARMAVHTTCTVVADDCSDATARIAAAAGAHVITVRERNVGAARRAGILFAREQVPSSPACTWIACTDADSAVPADWLVTHLEQRSLGAHVVLGPVRPCTNDLPPSLLRAWESRHRYGDSYRLSPLTAPTHIYGANMSFAVSAYDAVGGFSSLAVHEDSELVGHFQRQGFQLHSVATATVVTSGRRVGRAPAGFATYLRTLAERLESDEPA